MRASVIVVPLVACVLVGCVPLPPSGIPAGPDSLPPVSTTPEATPTPDGEIDATAWITAMKAEDHVVDVSWETADDGSYHEISILVDDDVEGDELQDVYESVFTHGEDTGLGDALADSVGEISVSSGARLVEFYGEIPENVDEIFGAWEWAQQFALREPPMAEVSSIPTITLRFDEDELPVLLPEITEGSPGAEVLDAEISIRAVGYVDGSRMCSWLTFRLPLTAAERDIVSSALTDGLAGHPEVCLDISTSTHVWRLYGVQDDDHNDLPDAVTALRDQLVAAGTNVDS